MSGLDFLRRPTVYKLARIDNGPERYFIVRDLFDDTHPHGIRTQALSLHGAWVDREQGFEVDPEITFLGDLRDSSGVLLDDIADGLTLHP